MNNDCVLLICQVTALTSSNFSHECFLSDFTDQWSGRSYRPHRLCRKGHAHSWSVLGRCSKKMNGHWVRSSFA